MKAFFVTGTDTGVGKTTVGAAILAAGTARGLRTRCMKPIESGCSCDADGDLIPHDARRLWSATDQQQHRDAVCVYRFEEPVAPGVAAERVGLMINFEPIQSRFDDIRAASPDLVLVEGAGGLLVPLGKDRMVADLAQVLALPLVIVARPGLGTINHTLLTIEAARSRGLDIAGVIFSASEKEPQEREVSSNAAEIQKASGIAVLGCLPYLPAARTSALARAAESSLDLEGLLSS